MELENFRSTKFVHSSSVPKVNHECQQRMVSDHLAFLTEKAPDMVREEIHKGRRGGLSVLVALLDFFVRQHNDLQTMTIVLVIFDCRTLLNSMCREFN
jgi:hypothetical protein